MKKLADQLYTLSSCQKRYYDYMACDSVNTANGGHLSCNSDSNYLPFCRLFVVFLSTIPRYITYGDLELFLCGIGLEDLVTLFQVIKFLVGRYVRCCLKNSLLTTKSSPLLLSYSPL